MPIFDRSFKADPFRFYDELRARGPLSEVELPTGVRCWLVTDHALVRALFADPRLSKSSRFAGHNWHRSHVNYAEGTSKPVFEHLLTLDAPEHTRLRKIVSRDFQPAHVARMEGAIARIVDEALDALPPDQPIDY